MEVISKIENKKLSDYAQEAIKKALERFDGKEVSVCIKEYKGMRNVS